MFFNTLQDELDEFGNIDHVCAPPIVLKPHCFSGWPLSLGKPWK